MRKSGIGGGGGGGGGKNLKFGLIGPASKLKNKAGGGGIRPIGAKPAPRRRPPGATAIFDTADSDDDGNDGGKGECRGDGEDSISGVAAVNKRLAAISAKQEKAAKKEYEDALAADPSVFDYDRAYDGMQASRESKAAAATTAREKEKRKPKYIGNLLKQAKLREVESDRIFERKLQKEREAQDKLEGEATMKFVTSAYKKKLMEQKKWELQQQLEEKREQREDVTKTGMSGFYSNLITKNIAMGGDVETSANSAFTTGSKRHAITDEYEMQEGNPRKATVKAQNSLADANVENNENSDAGNGGSDPDAPSARMVDPRAATGAGALGESGTSAAEITPTEQEARRKASLGKKEAAVGETAGADDGALVENFGAGSVRRRQENTSTVGMEGSARVADDAGDVLGRVGKRARSERVGGDGEEAGERERGSDRQRGQNEGGDEMEKGGEESAATAGLSEEERKAAEEVERVQRVAAAKARKEAAVKAARERFLARKGR